MGRHVVWHFCHNIVESIKDKIGRYRLKNKHLKAPHPNKKSTIKRLFYRGGFVPRESIDKLLPYHNFAGSKYTALGMENNLPKIIPSDEEIEKAQSLFDKKL